MGIPYVAVQEEADEPLVKELPNLLCVDCDLQRKGSTRPYSRFEGANCVKTLRRNQRKIETMIMMRDTGHR